MKGEPIISFGWTAAAVIAGRKRETRRAWKDSYAERFNAGDTLAAWTQLPYVKPKPGAEAPRRFGTVRLTEKPFKQSTADLAEDEWEAEGFGYLDGIGARVDGLTPGEFWDRWKREPVVLWVVRFEVVTLTPAPESTR